MKIGFSEKLKIPKDLTKKELLISITGSSEVFVENYKGILEYTDRQILVAGHKNTVVMKGFRLLITYYTDDEMLITGQFKSIEFGN